MNAFCTVANAGANLGAMRKAWLGFVLLLAAMQAAAADLRVQVSDQRGRPVAESMSDADPTLFAVGRYLDTLVRSGGRLLFKERIAVCDNHHVRRSLIMPI